MNKPERSTTMLKFSLDVEDGWPPVAVESLPFLTFPNGYTAQASPLFVKDLSVGDKISADLDHENNVKAWAHLNRSAHTTIWLLRLRQPNGIDDALAKLREVGCNTVGLQAAGCYSIDVPGTISMEIVDSILAVLDDNAVAVAFPSMRHPE